MKEEYIKQYAEILDRYKEEEDAETLLEDALNLLDRIIKG